MADYSAGGKTRKLTEEEKSLLKTVVEHFEDEDLATRVYKLRHIRRLKLYWNSISQIYWSESNGDYRIFGSEESANAGSDQGYYDRPVNVFRAFLETIIAALSIEIPGISCSPDDADNAADQATAKAGDKIAELLYKHNDAIFIWLRMLYVYMTEGLVASYQYEKEDKAYGTYNERKYEDEKIDAYACPHCAARIEDAIIESFRMQNPTIIDDTMQQMEAESEAFKFDELDEYAPDDDDVELHAALQSDKLVCPECGVELDPELQKSRLIVPRFVGMTQKPKSRICFDIFGELYIKVPTWARDQKDMPYLIWSYETNYVNVLERYKDDDDLWNKLPKGSNAPGPDPYQQYARLNPQYRNMYPDDQVTVRNAWLRPDAFNVLTKEQSEEFHKRFPDGCKVVVVDDLVVDACNENMDDCWTIVKNPLADFSSFDPIGELLVNIQDIVNDLISLILQTIEHGIPQTWADPAIVNFEAQRQVEANPGVITPTKPQGGTRNISEAFFATKASALSPEVFQFYSMINQLGQFVSAAMPSIFGGSQEAGSSRTASEYALSRTASLQRLQTPWRMFTIMWKTMFGKAIPAYIKVVKDDEHYTKKDKDGNYINVWVRKSELIGKIGDVELESAEGIPISDEQKAELVMRLMEMNNQAIASALVTPDNIPFLRKIVKIPEFKIPGEDDRQKQYEEINLLINSEPIEMEPSPEMIELAIQARQAPQLMEVSSVPIDPDVDNHAVEADVCRSWLVGQAGRLAKVENPLGYKNVLLHMKEHIEIVKQDMLAQMQQQAQQQQTPQGNSGSKPAKKPKQVEPQLIEGDSDVRVPYQ
jgi:hypothetical protein